MVNNEKENIPMSSNKKNHQKPAEHNPEQGADEAPATIDQAEEAAESLESAPEIAPESDPVIQPDETEAEMPAVIETVAAEPAPQAPANPSEGMASRLTKAVTAIVTTGNPESVHALHKVELIIGDLKNAIPAAIKAAEGEPLQSDLIELLAKL